MQGFNMGRYVPPELEGITSANAAAGKGHGLGSRARKLRGEGILTVRFECPFPIWCTTCRPEQIIGQGVRFNAEKKRVGGYHSTPIWSFRFKHSVCGGWLEVRTDPKHTQYVVEEGGRKRDEGTDKVLDGEIHIGVATEADKARLERDGGFGAVEKKVVDRQALMGQANRLEELAEKSNRDGEDPYEKNRALRWGFRVERKKREAEQRRGKDLQDKFSLGVDLVGENDEDAVRASLVQFGKTEDGRKREKGLFEGGGKSKKKVGDADLVTATNSTLARELRGNTRAAIDPFLASQTNPSWRPSLKRKRAEAEVSSDEPVPNRLVEYDSDSPYQSLPSSHSA